MFNLNISGKYICPREEDYLTETPLEYPSISRSENWLLHDSGYDSSRDTLKISRFLG